LRCSPPEGRTGSGRERRRHCGCRCPTGQGNPEVHLPGGNGAVRNLQRRRPEYPGHTHLGIVPPFYRPKRRQDLLSINISATTPCASGMMVQWKWTHSRAIALSRAESFTIDDYCPRPSAGWNSSSRRWPPGGWPWKSTRALRSACPELA